MNYKHLFYFWKVAQAGSITTAGRSLRLRPQTLSAQIQTLEEALGHPLFVRMGRRMQLTDTGQMVFEYANDMFLIGNELDEVLKGMPAERPMRLRVGIADVVPKLIACRFLEPALRCDRETHLVCHEGKLKGLLADLAVHQLDLVLADGPTNSNAQMRTLHYSLGAVGVSFFGTSSLRKQFAGPFPEMLHHAPLLMPMEGNVLRGKIGRWLDGLGIAPKIVAEFQDTALMKAFGQVGAGFFCVPSIIEDEIMLQHQVELVGQTHQVEAEYFAITTQRRVEHPAILAIQTRRFNG
ncbi:MAG: transcriptional activator NhaR [Magnetococcales bacterium]|nr:transcriptional activator NhaR [Magnetococcales bacterium]